ncbi:hypothetical protein ACGFYY_28830 [Streptomyces sp. NPDC048331]|uniref:hypothetical protein n=1 Tax=Streptomyces sp. NPDC048331 TaxID=3365534 RepID=UPI00371CC28B
MDGNGRRAGRRARRRHLRGRYADDAYAKFGGERIARCGVDGPHWLDLPLAEATARAAELTAWRDRLHGTGLMVSIGRRGGDRAHGQAYPVTLDADEAGERVMRGTIPPYDFDHEAE